jgi:hypothetical protein
MRHLSTFLFLFALLLFSSTTAGAENPAGNCTADFEYAPYSGPNPSVTGITFHNFSSGNYEEVLWDFGDDNYSSSLSPSLDHFYDDFGFYEVCLTIYGGDCDVQEYCQTIFVGEDSIMCDYTDCVYPGDANGDGKADLYDLLNIGLGLSSTGPPRPDATLVWTGQPAEDWGLATGEGVDFKHLDCDGNGEVNIEDVQAIETNYSLMEDTGLVYEDDGAPVELAFDVDTVFLDPNIPEKLPITGRLLLGSDTKPFENLHGLALYIKYSEEFFQDEVISANYQPSFLGQSAEVMMGVKDNRPAGQLDLAITSLTNGNKEGQGLVATVNFIIVGDIIGARVEPVVPVEFELMGVKGVDDAGNPQMIDIKGKPVVVVFKKEAVVNNKDLELDQSFRVFPNPADSELFVELNTDTEGTLTLFNAYGAAILQEPMRRRIHRLATEALSAGIYTLVFQTEEGRVVRRIVIQ